MLAEMLLCCRLRDSLPHQMPYKRTESLLGDKSPVDKCWLDMWNEEGEAMKIRAGRWVDDINAKAHDLAPLEVGDQVKVQNQTGLLKSRWSRTGVIMARDLQLNQYLVKMDGSRRTTARNRKFLMKIKVGWLEDKPRPEVANPIP